MESLIGIMHGNVVHTLGWSALVRLDWHVFFAAGCPRVGGVIIAFGAFAFHTWGLLDQTFLADGGSHLKNTMMWCCCCWPFSLHVCIVCTEYEVI
jgi:hypothetical protein